MALKSTNCSAYYAANRPTNFEALTSTNYKSIVKTIVTTNDKSISSTNGKSILSTNDITIMSAFLPTNDIAILSTFLPTFLPTNMSTNDWTGHTGAKDSYETAFSFESVAERMRQQDEMTRRLEVLERENRELRRMVSMVLDEEKKER